ncbi:hypothetical protein, partial [Bradyrhizobium campsiandrae]
MTYLAPYVPVADGNSGLTLAQGVDIGGQGNQTTNAITTLFPDYANNPNLSFISTFVGQTNAYALSHLAPSKTINTSGKISTAVSITLEQANAITNYAEQSILDKLSRDYTAKAATYGQPGWDALTASQQTAIFDFAYNIGLHRDPPKHYGLEDLTAGVAPTNHVWDLLAQHNWLGAASFLYKQYLHASKEQHDRRYAEADLLLDGQTSSLKFETGQTVANNTSYGFSISDATSQFALDPTGPSLLLTSGAGSPKINSFQLPPDDGFQYRVSYEVGTVWSTAQIVQADNFLTLPAGGVDGLSVTMLDSTGNLVSGSPDFAFYVTFASTGTFSANVASFAAPDAGPTITVTDLSAAHGQTFAASSLFSFSDAYGLVGAQYDFWYDGKGGGYFTLNGSPLEASKDNFVTAAQLSSLVFHPGTGIDTLWIKASDGLAWGNWSQSFTIVGAANHAPVVSASDYSATHSQNISASSLFSVSDADSDSMTAFRFWDSTSDGSSGHFVVNGVAQGTNQNIDVTAAQLASTTFQSGAVSDDLWVQAFDGTAWSAWKEFHVNPPVNHAPAVSVSDYSATHNQNVPASSLFSVSDADGDSMTAYRFWDSTTDASSGHFVVNGVAQGTNQNIDVTAAQLASTTFQSGAISDDLWVQAFDGSAWSTWKEFHVNPPVNHAPVVSASDYSATHNQNVAASSLFSVSDADGDSMTAFRFWDSTTDAGSGHFVVNGVTQGTNQNIDVTAAQL